MSKKKGAMFKPVFKLSRQIFKWFIYKWLSDWYISDISVTEHCPIWHNQENITVKNMLDLLRELLTLAHWFTINR